LAYAHALGTGDILDPGVPAGARHGEERHVVVGISGGRPRRVDEYAGDRPYPVGSGPVIPRHERGTGRGDVRIALNAGGGRDKEVPGRSVNHARSAKVRADLAAA